MTTTPTTPDPEPADLHPIAPDVAARIVATLPQEAPFLFVHTVDRHAFGVASEGTVTLPADHPVFDGHLPGNPIVPGVIVVEALAQLSGTVLVPATVDTAADGAAGKATAGYLAEVRRMRFRRPVKPGETLRMRSRLVRKFLSAASFEVEAEVDGEPVAAGEIVVGGMA